MREDLLHYIWQYKKIPLSKLFTEQKEELQIINFGFPNSGEGPDFLNARILIDDQQWAGNIEMHLKSSDWYAHHHEIDKNYDNVILHVVWEDDIAVFRKDGSQIATLVLQHLIPEELLVSYQALMDTSKIKFINCERSIADMAPVMWKSWEERLYFERLEQKSKHIGALLQKSNNNWEAVLFSLLCKSFGTKINGSFFLNRALKLDFSIVRKTSTDLLQLESLLFGHFGLLEVEDCTDRYYLELKKEYGYLTQKFELEIPEEKPAFYGMRPTSFPTLRISQLANLYYKNCGFFQRLMAIDSLEDYYHVFQVLASSYWENHFTFGKSSKKSKRQISKAFIDLLLINTVIPLKFSYAQRIGKQWNEELVDLISKIKSESNTIVEGFNDLKVQSENALESQAKIQLYTAYCSQKKCLHCAVGVNLLNRNVYF
ncbi:DUF2851 family protein [Flagellimonas meridianipacifica]|uniref:Uncharacterized protein DUF2851 n=1 Tax=Flagellimonas meridianipacifica TaxID=1080225 RepID=A0A2T0M6P3_9FLAO|nr:DUF2851 family protein [Allomuricauda pacifica]PRX53131.1 uncharacterized protein DUF2851 [Allomuricauda pacifica]